MRQWTLIYLMIAMLTPGLALSEATQSTLTADLADQLDIKENAFAKLSDDPKVNEVDVGDRSREVALFGLIRLPSSGEALLQGLASERNGTLLGPSIEEGFFGRPASAKDLSKLALPDGDFEVLASCKPRDCKFKLDQEGIEKAQSINWDTDAGRAEFVEYFRRSLAQYVETFRKQGASALIVYDDKPEPFALAKGDERLRARMSLWPEREPALFAYLGEYPNGKPESVTDVVYWSLKDFGYRPTLAVDLIVIDSSPQTPGVRALFVQRTLYADHYLAARYQSGALLDGPEALGVPGHFMLLTDHMLFDDGLGSFKRSLLGRGMQSDMRDRLKSIAQNVDQ
jgi:hypothetical protein